MVERNKSADEATARVRVLLADDHGLVRSGFRRLLEDHPEIVVVGEAANGEDAVRLAESLRPDVAVLDITMPGMDGLEAAAVIAGRHPCVAILFVSMHADSAYLRSAREVGAAGYVLKSAAEEDLPEAVLRVARGEKVFPIAPLPLSEEEAQLASLTPRERQVLGLLASGKANKEIASMLGVSVNTVAVHRARLMDTLGIRGTAELTLFAVRSGLVSPR
jgi:DNA-binding NarL/FixJ family response regulator